MLSLPCQRFCLLVAVIMMSFSLGYGASLPLTTRMTTPNAQPPSTASTTTAPFDPYEACIVQSRLCNVKIGGGVQYQREFLSVPSNGLFADLYTQDDQSGRQRWRFLPIIGEDYQYHIMVVGGTDQAHKFLSATEDGAKVDLYDRDDGSGRQRWNVFRAGEMPGQHFAAGSIRVSNVGVKSSGRLAGALLSASADGAKVDLWGVDDNSGRQLWVLAPVL
jgi:hypothetical protein